MARHPLGMLVLSSLAEALIKENTTIFLENEYMSIRGLVRSIVCSDEASCEVLTRFTQEVHTN